MPPRAREVYDPSAEESPPSKRASTAYGSSRTHIFGTGGLKPRNVARPPSSTNPELEVETPSREPIEQTKGTDSSYEADSNDGKAGNKDTSKDPGSSTDTSSTDTTSESDEESDEGKGGDSRNESEESSTSDSSDSSESSEEDKSECKPKATKSNKKSTSTGSRKSKSSAELSEKEERELLRKLTKKYGNSGSKHRDPVSKASPVPLKKARADSEVPKAAVSGADSKAAKSSKLHKPKSKPKSKSKVADSELKMAAVRSGQKSKKLKVDSETEGEATDISHIELTPGDIGLANYIRLVLTRLGGWQNLQAIDAQPLDATGHPMYWLDDQGSRKLRPNWENTLDVDWKVWGQVFMAEFRTGEGFTSDVSILSQLPEDVVKKKLTTTWKHCRTVWRSKKKGVGGAAKIEKQIKMAERNRSVAKMTQRDELMEGTILEKNPDYEFVKYQELQSPEASDAEDKTHKVVDDPDWRSEAYRLLLGALNQKGKGMKKRTSAMKKTRVHYVKVDTPIPPLCGGNRIPRWAIDDNYYESHKAEMEEKAYMIDLNATTVPDSLKRFLREFGKEPREYLEALWEVRAPDVGAKGARS